MTSNVRARASSVDGFLPQHRDVFFVRRMQERAAAARRDLLHGRRPPAEAARLFMPTVVVQIAGEVDLHVHAALREHLFAQVDEVGLVEDAAHVPVLLRVHPHGHRQAQDHLVARLHVALGDLAEVLHLRHVEVALQLAVAAHQPPAMRELQHEVAAALARPPAGEATTADVGAEQPRERREPVVPVVIAGHGVEVRPFAGLVVAEGRSVRRDQAALILLAARRRDTPRRRRGRARRRAGGPRARRRGARAARAAPPHTPRRRWSSSHRRCRRRSRATARRAAGPFCGCGPRAPSR